MLTQRTDDLHHIEYDKQIQLGPPAATIYHQSSLLDRLNSVIDPIEDNQLHVHCKNLKSCQKYTTYPFDLMPLNLMAELSILLIDILQIKDTTVRAQPPSCQGRFSGNTKRLASQNQAKTDFRGQIQFPTFASLWQCRQSKTSLQQGARILHLLL